ncbi:MAG: lipoprotein insertase outer membrane protein LolB [Candidatus Competibacteraceae bacterium]
MSGRLWCRQWKPHYSMGLIVLVLLAGCATPVETATHPAWPARQRALSALRDWSVNGRLAVTTTQEGWHVSLYWVQQGPVYTIDLIGPLGQGRVRIQGDAQGVGLRTADGQFQRAGNADELLARTVGVRIPLNGLLYWMRGLPDPGQPSTLALDEQGRLSRLEQGGWRIEYLDYMPVAALELPRRMRATQGEIKVQVLVSDWSLAPATTVAGGR